MNCVDSETFAAETPAEQTCIKNCQDKVYASFELYMGVRKYKEASASTVIDRSAYTGMEVEHSNDTSGSIRTQNQKTMDVQGIERFTKFQQRTNKDLRIEAYKKVWGRPHICKNPFLLKQTVALCI